MRVAPWAVLLVGLLITFVIYDDARKAARERQRADFSAHAQKVADTISSTLTDYEHVLLGAGGLFAASEEVTRSEFRAYVKGLGLDHHFPGFDALGFARAIAPAERERHIEAMRRSEFPDYTLEPPGERDLLGALVFREPPLETHVPVLGYDMYSDPVRRKAMERARDTGAVSVSDEVQLRLGADAGARDGFVMYLAVYGKGEPPQSLEARRSALHGWIVAPFRMHRIVEPLMANRLRATAGILRLRVYAGAPGAAGAPIHDSAALAPGAGASTVPESFAPRYVATHPLSLGGHTWTLQLSSLPSFEAQLDASKAQRILAVSGAALSLLVALIVYLLDSAHRRARRIARQMTQELAESEGRFRLLAESAPVMIWMSDASHSCVWMNQRWRDFSGRSLAPNQRHIWREIIHPDDYHHAAEAYFAVLERREPFRTEFRVRRADGVYRWIINTGVPRFDADGELAGYIGSCLDITERRQAERQLQEMAQRLEQTVAEVNDLYQNAPCGYHSLDAQGNIVSINDTELRWLGYSREELIGRPIAMLLSEDSRADFARNFPPSAIQSEYRDTAYELVRRDGSILPVSISATLVRDKDGRFLRTRSVVHDMTEHRRVERERAEHARHVEALSHRLVAVQEEERRRLAASLYDWTSPNLATLKLLLNSIDRACEAGDVARIHGAVEDAEALLDDTTAGLREIGSELRPTVLDFAGLLPALDSYGHQLRMRTGIEVHIRPASLGSLSSEAQTVLFRIAQEALSNCVKHAGATMVELALEPFDGGIRMTISDDGKGFDAAALAGADEPEGLGLISMRERAEFIGGRLSIHSSPGTGATILVEIPVDRATAPTQIALALSVED